MSYALYIAWCAAVAVIAIGAGFVLIAACKVIWILFLLISEVLL